MPTGALGDLNKAKPKGGELKIVKTMHQEDLTRRKERGNQGSARNPDNLSRRSCVKGRRQNLAGRMKS